MTPLNDGCYWLSLAAAWGLRRGQMPGGSGGEQVHGGLVVQPVGAV
jgi:hypothetical protein